MMGEKEPGPLSIGPAMELLTLAYATRSIDDLDSAGEALTVAIQAGVARYGVGDMLLSLSLLVMELTRSFAHEVELTEEELLSRLALAVQVRDLEDGNGADGEPA